jgi:uncharacterized membrane protein YkgB
LNPSTHAYCEGKARKKLLSRRGENTVLIPSLVKQNMSVEYTKRPRMRPRAQDSGIAGVAMGTAAYFLACLAWTFLAVNFTLIPSDWQPLAGLVGAVLSSIVLITTIAIILAIPAAIVVGAIAIAAGVVYFVYQRSA